MRRVEDCCSVSECLIMSLVFHLCVGSVLALIAIHYVSVDCSQQIAVNFAELRM